MLVGIIEIIYQDQQHKLKKPPGGDNGFMIQARTAKTLFVFTENRQQRHLQTRFELQPSAPHSSTDLYTCAGVSQGPKWRQITDIGPPHPIHWQYRKIICQLRHLQEHHEEQHQESLYRTVMATSAHKTSILPRHQLPVSHPHPSDQQLWQTTRRAHGEYVLPLKLNQRTRGLTLRRECSQNTPRLPLYP